MNQSRIRGGSCFRRPPTRFYLCRGRLSTVFSGLFCSGRKFCAGLDLSGETEVGSVGAQRCLGIAGTRVRRRCIGALAVHVPGAAFLHSFGHPSHASENPTAKPCSGLWSTSPITFAHLRRLCVCALRFLGGIVFPVLRRKSIKTRRLNSSLRSHRTCRSSRRQVYSGLNKTLFAVGRAEFTLSRSPVG